MFSMSPDYNPTYLYFSKMSLTDARRGFIASRLQFFCQDENVIALDCENNTMVGKSLNALNEGLLYELPHFNPDLPDLMRLYKVYSGARLLAYTNGESYISYTKEMYQNAEKSTSVSNVGELFLAAAWVFAIFVNTIYINDVARYYAVEEAMYFYLFGTIGLVVVTVLGIAYCATIRGIKRRAAAALAGNDIG